MPSHPPLRPKLLRMVSLHLDAEIQHLQRLQNLSAVLTASDSGMESLSAQQGELAAVAEEAHSLRLQREALRCEVAAAWQCAPQEVRLAEIAADPSPLAAGLTSQQEQLLEMVSSTAGRLRATQMTLGLWNGVVNSLLSSLLGGGREGQRYSASGQLVTPTQLVSLTMRT